MRHPNLILRPWWGPLKAERSGRARPLYRQVLPDHFGTVACLLLLACAVLWATAEHGRQKAELRMAETNRYIAAFKSPPVADAWRHLTDVWHAQAARQNALLGRIAQASGQPLQIEQRNYRAFVIDTVADHALAHDIDTVIRFYRRLAGCIRIGSCDGDLAASLFGRTAWSFRNQHYYYLQDEYRIDQIDRVLEVIAPDSATSAGATLP